MFTDVSKTNFHRRKKVGSKYKDQRKFSRTADRLHKANLRSRPMRGGIRM